MSYDIALLNKQGKIHEFNFHLKIGGGTYVVGGTPDASINITYNYHDQFEKVFGGKGIRSLYGMDSTKSIPVLVEAIRKLAVDKTKPESYWQSTEGNARKALWDMLTLAVESPDCDWCGD